MSKGDQTGNSRLTDLNRSEILKAVVTDAESMGLRDKDKIERLTSRVIERLEHPQPLPGMEDFVPRSRRASRRIPSRAEIQAIVKQIMEEDEHPEKPLTEKPEKPMEAEEENTRQREKGGYTHDRECNQG